VRYSTFVLKSATWECLLTLDLTYSIVTFINLHVPTNPYVLAVMYVGLSESAITVGCADKIMAVYS